MMNLLKVRDILRLINAFVFAIIYIAHLLVVAIDVHCCKKILLSDLKRIGNQVSINLPFYLLLLFELHNNRYFRTLFYKRIGPAASFFISWYRPGDKYFAIANKTKIGEGFMFAHPFATVLNAESIGKNFFCLNNTTLGEGKGGAPIIGNDVWLGANVNIIGNVHIGNNVSIGAGSVVVKDIPDNCVAAGNPCKIIRYKTK